MSHAFILPAPRIVPPLDPGFRPPVLANRAFEREVADADGDVTALAGSMSLDDHSVLGIALGSSQAAAEKLKAAQALLEAGHEGATAIWRTMGVNLGYTVAHYADFYPVRHVLILGRCTSGRGWTILLDEARRVLSCEFPDLASRVNIQLPDEKSRRVGQSIAAASLPALKGDAR